MSIYIKLGAKITMMKRGSSAEESRRNFCGTLRAPSEENLTKLFINVPFVRNLPHAHKWLVSYNFFPTSVHPSRHVRTTPITQMQCKPVKLKKICSISILNFDTLSNWKFRKQWKWFLSHLRTPKIKLKTNIASEGEPETWAGGL